MDAAPTPEIDEATIAPVVRRLLGRSDPIAAWEIAPIGAASLGLSGGLFRVTGTLADGTTWSAVLKVLRPIAPAFLARFPESDRALLAEGYLWDREARLYDSALLDELPSGFSAARCVGSHRTDAACWLWFEDLGADSRPWDISRYALAARHLGRFNGAFLTSRARPDGAWLCHGWIRTWLLHGHPSLHYPIVENTAIWEHELVRQSFPADTNARLRRVGGRRRQLLDQLDALPQTFCHMDAFRSNLFDRTRDGIHETVAIDWSYAGNAAIGVEVGQLVLASVLPFANPTKDARELAAACVPAYLAGLREAGWGGDEADVQTGFALSAIRHVFMLGFLNGVLDLQRQEQYARWTGTPYQELVARAARGTTHMLDLIEGVSG